MKRIVLLATSLLLALGAMAVDKEKVAKANTRTMDGLVTFALAQKSKAYESGAAGPNTFDNGGLIQYSYKQIGYELPTDVDHLQTQGTLVKKVEKLQIGDIIFLQGKTKKTVGEFGIVYRVEADGAFEFIHVTQADGVKVSTSENYKFFSGVNITSDKTLANLRKEYEKEQKEIEKANIAAQKAQAKAEAEAAKAAKAKEDAEKAAQKAQEKADKANANAEKAAEKADKANPKVTDLEKQN